MDAAGPERRARLGPRPAAASPAATSPVASRRLALLGLAGALLTVSGRAAASCSDLHRRDLAYDMRVAGVRIAELELRVRCNGPLAYVEMHVVNRGLAAFFAGRNRTTMTAFVGFDAAGAPLPVRFRASYQKPDRLRETELEFASDGSLSHLITYNQGRVQESPVPAELHEPSIDPLATILQLSDWLARQPAPGEHRVFPVFEGRKRADLEIVFDGETEVAVNGQSYDAYRLKASLEGLAGFDKDDAFVALPGEPPSWLDVYATKEPMPVPLLITSNSNRLPARIELIDD